VPHNLISAQESPVPLPKFQNLTILLVQERSPDILSCFSQKLPASDSLPGSPVEPLGREIPACGTFLHLSKYIVFLSECPVRETPPYSLTGSPRTGILRHQSHWPSEGILFIYLFIHSFIHVYLLESPKGALLHTYRKNIRSPSMQPQADGRPTYNEVRHGSPRVSLTTLLSLHPCHAAFGTIPSTLAWVDQSPVSQRVS